MFYTGSIEQWCGITFAFYENELYSWNKIDSNPLCYAHNLYINDELLTYLVIPEGIKEIKPSAFGEATCITAIKLPNSLVSIGKRAFYNCTGLTSITIPNSVEYIGEDAFKCSNLVYVTTSNCWNGRFTSSAFYDCESLSSSSLDIIREMDRYYRW